MAALPEFKHAKDDPFVSGFILDRYKKSDIRELTFNDDPFLITGDAWALGSSADNFDRIITASIVSEEDCAGHFGPKFPSGQENLKIPLLHLTRTMNIAGQLAAGLIHPGMIPMPIFCRNVKANNQNLISPPVIVIAGALQFKSVKNQFIVERAFSYANGEPYAEMEELTFELIPVNQFKRTNNVDSGTPQELLGDYRVKRDIYRSEIEELILEREPFHRLDRAILAQSQAGDLKVITISRITKQDCAGQFLIDGQSTISPIDYCRLMALTAELLASIITRERFNGLSVVPVAVRVDQVSTPNLRLLSPPITTITEANISAKNLCNPVMIRRNKDIFWADNASVWVEGINVARMDKIVYALVPETTFLKEGRKT